MEKKFKDIVNFSHNANNDFFGGQILSSWSNKRLEKKIGNFHFFV
jgi:hypothetical protein